MVELDSQTHDRLFSEELARFDENRRRVNDLVHFDRSILELLDDYLKPLLELIEKFLSPAYSVVKNRASAVHKSIRNMRETDSLKRKYQVVYNQCVVLLVSHFASALSGVFKEGVRYLIKNGRAPRALLRDDIKLSLEELLGYASSATPADEWTATLFVDKKGVSFQDMKSIREAFEETFGVKIAWDKTVNDIILAQACRNAIVHSGEVADNHCIGQLRNSIDRTLKRDLKLGQRIEFTEQDLGIVEDRMTAFLETLAAQLRDRLTVNQDSTN